MRSQGRRCRSWCRWYLRSPIKPLAGQMLVVATRPQATPQTRVESRHVWHGRTVSVVLPTYNEKDSIADVHPGGSRSSAWSTRSSSSTTTPPRAPPRRSPDQRARGLRDRPGLRRGDPPRACRGRRRPDLRLRAGRHLRAGDLVKLLAYTDECDFVVGSRTVSHVHLGRRQHGLVPPVGQLGRGQDDRGAVQHHLAVRRRLHVPGALQGARPRPAARVPAQRLGVRAGDAAARARHAGCGWCRSRSTTSRGSASRR